jgi:SAM-dependent methyltransferase
MDPEYVQSLQTSYDRIAGKYADAHFGELQHKPLDRALLAAFSEMAAGHGRAADIGCGPGQVARYLVGLGMDVMGIDLSKGMVSLAQDLNPGIPFIQASMLDLPLHDGSLAGITAFYCIIHVPPDDRPGALAEFRRVLRPEGVLLLAFHVGDETLHQDEFFGEPVSLDFHFLHADDLKREVEAAGFAVEAYLQRQPYIGFEHPSTRGYILARA